VRATVDLLADLRGHDRDRWLAALFVPEKARADVAAFAALNWEIARIRDSVSEPLLGRMRLQWWRETVDGLYEGRTRQHPIADALAAALRRQALPKRAFERLIDGRARDLDDEPFVDLDELEAHARETAAPLLELAVAALGGEAMNATAEVAHRVGTAYGLAVQLAAAPIQRAKGRERIPASRFAYAEIVARARMALVAARARRGDIPAALRAAFLIGRIAESRLDEIARANFDPFALPTQSFARALRPLTLAWAAWRECY